MIYSLSLHDARPIWLTEDEMVWQGDEKAAPRVLGTGD
ncbi:hypothetical protein ONO23_04817 [Micromonospora noduli]|nr:hypothetical protein ONO23_04817 [Micromonospora noduli]